MVNASRTSICIIGTWHQGVVGAACLADLGYDVLGADPDAKNVEGLNQGKASLYEPGLDDLLKSGLEAGRLKFTSDVAKAVVGRRFVLVMFDTPVDENDQSDLTPIFDAARAFAKHLEPNVVILVTAQVPVGTCDELAALIRKENPGVSFGIAYSPENLRLGQAIKLFLEPALPVIGANDDATLDAVEDLLGPLGANWERVSLRTAEMAKHGLNAFLATSICFGNELGNICDEVGADGKRLAEVLRLEPRIGSKAMLLPGMGFSGGTIARDMQTLRGLGDDAGLDTPFLDGVWAANQVQNRFVLRKLTKACPHLDGLRVTVLGLTYKPDTSTLRRSAALDIIDEMVRAGVKVTAHDPKAERSEIAEHDEFEFVEDPYVALEGAEAMVVITGWKEYRDLDFGRVKAAMKNPLIIDANNMLDADRLEGLGFTYLDVGRGRKV